jgi:hypothetical protein
MTKITVKLKDYDVLHDLFKQAPEKTAKEINIAVQKVILKVQGSAMKLAPIQSGKLRQSVTSQMTGIGSGKVEVGSSYGIFVHDGTKPHIIQVKKKRCLANVKTGQIFGKIVHHPGTKANPFLQNAADTEMTFIDKVFGEAVDNIMK